jgi:hypothetical protein
MTTWRCVTINLAPVAPGVDSVEPLNEAGAQG